MKSKLASEHDGRTFVLILDQDEEAFAAISAFANEQAINAASVAAIGAFESAKVGWFDLAAKRYSPISVDEQCEVLSLLGDIAQGDDGKASSNLGVPLQFQLTSAAVMNAFFIPQFGSMIYTMNGMVTRLNLRADAARTFQGLSTQF